MASSTRNVQLGICKIFYDGKDLGYTKGGVEVSVSTETYRVEIDQFGKTAINEQIQGRNVQVTCPLAETTLDNLMEIMPGAKMFSDGVQATASLTFTVQPTTSTGTITIGGQVFTFVSTAPTGSTQVKIGASLAASIQNLIFTVNNFAWGTTTTPYLAGGLRASLDSVNPLKVNLTAMDRGTAGNAITLVAAAPSGSTASGATLSAGANTTRARVEVRIGTDIDMLAIAKVLRLHPTKKADNDYSDDFILYQATPAGSLQYAYQVDSERVFNVTFTAYPDPNSSDSRMFSVGDPFYQP